jgi:hypothetical protein
MLHGPKDAQTSYELEAVSEVEEFILFMDDRRKAVYH